jgi:hypothetical protein
MRHGAGRLVQNVRIFSFCIFSNLENSFSLTQAQGCTVEGTWFEDKRHGSSIMSWSPLGDVRVTAWNKDRELYGACVRGTNVFIGHKFEDGFIKGTGLLFLSVSLLLLLYENNTVSSVSSESQLVVLGICVMMGLHESISLISNMDQRSAACISLVLPSAGPHSDFVAAFSQEPQV